MTQSEQPNPPEGDKPNEAQVFSQPFQNQPVAARVPERVGRGVFATGLLVQDGPFEFVLDFMQQLSQPRQVIVRVVLSPGVMGALVRTLDENLQRFIQTYGPPQALPKPPTQHRPSIQEIYENFKLPEELWSGVYANSVLVGHGPSEFLMDFITGFYPTAAVSARVFFAAQQAPRMLETLRSSFMRRTHGQQQQHQPPPPRKAEEQDEGSEDH